MTIKHTVFKVKKIGQAKGSEKLCDILATLDDFRKIRNNIASLSKHRSCQSSYNSLAKQLKMLSSLGEVKIKNKQEFLNQTMAMINRKSRQSKWHKYIPTAAVAAVVMLALITSFEAAQTVDYSQLAFKIDAYMNNLGSKTGSVTSLLKANQAKIVKSTDEYIEAEMSRADLYKFLNDVKTNGIIPVNNKAVLEQNVADWSDAEYSIFSEPAYWFNGQEKHLENMSEQPVRFVIKLK